MRAVRAFGPRAVRPVVRNPLEPQVRSDACGARPQTPLPPLRLRAREDRCGGRARGARISRGEEMADDEAIHASNTGLPTPAPILATVYGYGTDHRWPSLTGS